MRRAPQLRHALVPALLTAALAAVASLAPVAAVVPGCAAAGSNHAPLVVEHANGTVVTRCVAFNSGSISGEELLIRSGVAWSGQTYGGFGAAVCAIDAEPARYASCPGQDHYWAVFVSRGGGVWQLANRGISALSLADGDAEGFRYVPSAGTPSAPSAPAAPGVCNPLAAAATATAGAMAAATVRESPALGVAGVAAAASAPSRPRDGSPDSGSGLDIGLLAAAVASGGLAGLALLRLLASRHWAR